MKKMISLMLLLMISLAFYSCEEDNVCDTNTEDIYRVWKREITDSQGVTFEALLTFNVNGVYDFVLVGDVPGHTNSTANFTIDCDKFTIFEDADCENEATYKFEFFRNPPQDELELKLIAIDDDCEGRKAAIEGNWTEVIGI